jgi:trehalose 6-phosphate phosphatase
MNLVSSLQSNTQSNVALHLLNTCKQAVASGKTLVLLLDYDGTLTPIVQRPEDAQLSADGLTRLKRLSLHPQVRLALISGRSVEQLKHFTYSILPAPILMAGLHGGQLYDAEHEAWLSQPSEALEQAKVLFQQIVLQAISDKGNLPEGVAIEEKGFSFAVHYRLAHTEVAERIPGQVQALFQQSESAQAQFRLQHGHCVIEIVPKTFNKGAGVQSCLAHWGLKPEASLVVFAGDDKTDEVGIRAAVEFGGLGVAVGVKPSAMAGLTLEQQDQVMPLQSPAEVQMFLEHLLEYLYPAQVV